MSPLTPIDRGFAAVAVDVVPIGLAAMTTQVRGAEGGRPVAGPHAAARGRRRRPGGWWLLVLPVVALLMLLLADRLLVGVAEQRMTSRLACLGRLTGARAVHIDGFPFLNQVASGHFDAVTMTADGVRGASRLTDLAVTFRDLRLPPLSGLVGRPSPEAVTVGSIDIAATVRLAGSGSAATGSPGAGSPAAGPLGSGLLAFGSAAGGSPFPFHLDTIRPVPGGLRVTLTVAGAAVEAAAGRFESDCAADAAAPVPSGHGSVGAQAALS
ncbi:DUF2993 domain-containing protein [Frankia sp. AgB32]|uniref:LmeA family phospholipid-binding protein n=1 Tax=Frankia sp. AgB32 TaxID=631119 RepID=UPI00200CEA9B|nr:DUF2993 domain-containing protein [Frankia sp. AgB32]MCK9894150.1 DUF2993 domain-containing protein [Frankia sp. AgB32]